MPKGVVMAALAIRQDYEPASLRRRAARGDRRPALRLLAIANALEGMPSAEAAWLAGMERQALRDAVLRFNAEGPAGLHDKPRPGRPEPLSDGQRAALKAQILRSPAGAGWGSSPFVSWIRASTSRSSTGRGRRSGTGLCPVSPRLTCGPSSPALIDADSAPKSRAQRIPAEVSSP
jgi:hypothetical protein